MAAQVGEWLAVRIERQCEARAESGERIARVARLHGREAVWGAQAACSRSAYSNGRLGTASPESAGTCSSSR